MDGNLCKYAEDGTTAGTEYSLWPVPLCGILEVLLELELGWNGPSYAATLLPEIDPEEAVSGGKYADTIC